MSRLGPSRQAEVVRTAPVPSPVVDLASRRAGGDAAVARLAAAPVLHVTPEFLAALNCRDLQHDLPVRARVLHAV
jgi:hypothetical protein